MSYSSFSHSDYPLPLMIIIFFFALFLNLATPAAAQGNETDSHALLALKSNLHDPQGLLDSWNHSVHFCEWQGVTCGGRHRRVTVLNLSSSGLVGSLSPHIGNLSFLRQIILQNNSLQGQIPPEIGRLFRLQLLLLFDNSLEGKIPANLSHCTSLSVLGVGKNKLVGEIPKELATLSNLHFFSVSKNSLSGEIMSSFANLTALEFLYISYNAFEGSIPDSFGGLKKLRVFGVDDNKFYGMVPLSIYNLSSLTMLILGHNQLVGSLPHNLGTSLPLLQWLDIGETKFTGTIPISLSNATELGHIEIYNTNVMGKIPTNFGSLKRLQCLNLENNVLGNEEADDMTFLNSLTNCRGLDLLSVRGNKLGGVLPNSLNLSIHLRFFDVADNQISGVIPSGFGSLVNLETLDMGYNQFVGVIPDDIGKIQQLQILNLPKNRLSGEIPTSLGNLSSLSRLNLEDNKLQGTIPSSLGNYKNLLRLNLSQNAIGGTIPKQLFSASPLSESLNLARNHLVGPIPSEVGKLKNLAELDVSENRLSGEIPTELGKCSDLVSLYLGGNFFEGSIPPSLESLRGIKLLDISSNNLSGILPIFLANFSLESLNLSFNNFEGELPTTGVFKNVSAISIVGNNHLCGGISALQLPRCKTTKSKERRFSRVDIMLILGGCLLLIVAIVSLFLIICWLRKKKLVNFSGYFPKESFLTVSYEDLLKATDGFSSKSLIGVGSFGSVYKGILDRDEMMVAIKVLNLQRQGASKSFMAECEALRNIRHRNLVKIITSCSSIDFQGNGFKALVYEFMPNGSLERWLNSSRERGGDNMQDDEPRILNLHQRISIAIDVACALQYLHDHCEKPIVHCDIKPSNILLDRDMVAHVGDFGLARFLLLPELSKANQSNSSIGIRGTIGYVAPEYGLGGEVSINGDVYSYGILLLEMMTGRSPIDPMFNEGLNLHNFAKTALPDHVTKIVEPALLLSNDEDGMELAIVNNDKKSKGQSTSGNRKEDCLISMVKIGVACSMESPKDRMGLNHVIRELYSVKGILGGA